MPGVIKIECVATGEYFLGGVDLVRPPHDPAIRKRRVYLYNGEELTGLQLRERYGVNKMKAIQERLRRQRKKKTRELIDFSGSGSRVPAFLRKGCKSSLAHAAKKNPAQGRAEVGEAYERPSTPIA